LKILDKLSRSINKRFGKDPDRFLAEVSGVIHVGANAGQERETYKQFNLDVIWIEPIPEVYEVLTQNLTSFDRQIAYKYLITDEDNKEYKFNIANNSGLSSSILDLKHHQDLWPDIKFERTVKLKSITLPSFMQRESVTASKFDALVMDTQGSELLVLKGSEPVLQQFKYIKTEVSDFESYDGCCLLDEMTEYLSSQGFCEHSRNAFAFRKEGGSYYDIWYKRINL